jgi:hypothetical protein
MVLVIKIKRLERTAVAYNGLSGPKSGSKEFSDVDVMIMIKAAHAYK